MSGFLLVGITGGSGSGKSLLTDYFVERGYSAVDGDVVAREVLQPGSPVLQNLAQVFGSDILTPIGTLDRQLLALKAFASKENTEKLNQITHPKIIEIILEKAQKAKENRQKIFFVDAAVIVGGFLQKYCDKIIVVDAEVKVRENRVMRRDGVTLMQAQQRISAQMPVDLLKKSADFIVENNSGKENLHKQADEILMKLLS